MDCENKTNVQIFIFYIRRAMSGLLCNRPPSTAELTDFCVTSVMARVVANVFVSIEILVLASSWRFSFSAISQVALIRTK